MIAELSHDSSVTIEHPHIEVTGSKSESNRLLILQALFPQIEIENLSNSDDTQLLQQAIKDRDSKLIDIHHAGTAMRFLTAYFSAQQGRNVVLTGSERMKQRPVSLLVDALRKLGAKIDYRGEESYPPLQITGTTLRSGEIEIAAGTSSQYISALLLIAPSLSNGLKIRMQGMVTSRPYIEMTCQLLKQLGCTVIFSENYISVDPLDKPEESRFTVESDWSSASYFYSLVALSEGLSVTLKNYKKESLQGDSHLVRIYEKLGVETRFDAASTSISLTKKDVTLPKLLELDLAKTPDIAQTIAVSCFGLGIGCKLSGLHTLKIKETDRLVALQTELQKLGAMVEITDNMLQLSPSEAIKSGITIKTYNDHRMAMAFAPLALKQNILIEDPEVVSKSFPSFWEAMTAVGIKYEIKR
ncbi:MAG: 3-phosphoshikimate 1-carboxyvinyltransferase [Flavobacterium sp.]|nr:MAG: 3-phosphoshikimate 1-carboxyvinyltransferase [Flavobacterium sp.]